MTALFLGLALTLGCAWVLGAAARRVGQPAVLGELGAGVLLGPTVLGRWAPGVESSLFPSHDGTLDLRTAVVGVAAGSLLLLAGIRVDTGTVARVGRAASASSAGLLIAFLAGLIPGLVASRAVGWVAGDRLLFALFLGVALSISAFPAVARTVIDLELLGTDVGMMVLASSVVQDVFGIALLGLILPISAGRGFLGASAAGVLAVGVVTLGARAVDRLLAAWPGGGLAVACGGGLLSAGFAQILGADPIVGAFFAGAAVGASPRMEERPRAQLEALAMSVVSPLFFGGVGLELDLGELDLGLAVTLLGLTTLGKVGGGFAGARLAGLGARHALAVGAAMNARGGIEVVLGWAAWHGGLIDARLLGALVATAVATTATSGALVSAILGGRRSVRFVDVISAPTFVPRLQARDATEAIEELSRVLSGVSGLPTGDVNAAVLDRERAMRTGVPGEIALPHAAFPGLTRPLVAIGLAPDGIDFGAPDAAPARVVCLVLTAPGDQDGQTSLLADIGRTLHRPEVRSAIGRIREFSEFAALVRRAARPTR